MQLWRFRGCGRALSEPRLMGMERIASRPKVAGHLRCLTDPTCLTLPIPADGRRKGTLMVEYLGFARMRPVRPGPSHNNQPGEAPKCGRAALAWRAAAPAARRQTPLPANSRSPQITYGACVQGLARHGLGRRCGARNPQRVRNHGWWLLRLPPFHGSKVHA